MEKELHYFLALKQGAISHADAQKYIKLLEESTLNRITHMDFDRRLIKPILKMAWEKNEKSLSDFPCGFNCTVNNILDDKKLMFKLMRYYCIK